MAKNCKSLYQLSLHPSFFRSSTCQKHIFLFITFDLCILFHQSIFLLSFGAIPTYNVVYTQNISTFTTNHKNIIFYIFFYKINSLEVILKTVGLMLNNEIQTSLKLVYILQTNLKLNKNGNSKKL